MKNSFDRSLLGKIQCKKPISEKQWSEAKTFFSKQGWKLVVIFSDEIESGLAVSALFSNRGFEIELGVRRNVLTLEAPVPDLTNFLQKHLDQLAETTMELCALLGAECGFFDLCDEPSGEVSVTKIISDDLTVTHWKTYFSKANAGLFVPMAQSKGPSLTLKWLEGGSLIVTKKMNTEHRGKPSAEGLYDRQTLSLTRKQYWQKVEESGWFDGLTMAQRAAFEKSFVEIFPRAPRQAIDCLSVFEVEFNDFGESYSEVLQGLARATGGVFQPTEISEKVNSDGEIVVAFSHGKYRYQMVSDHSRIDDEEIFTVANKALKDLGSQRLFRPLNVGHHQDDWIRIGFVTEQALRKAEELGILPLQPEEISW